MFATADIGVREDMFGKPDTADTHFGVVDMHSNSFHEIFELMKLAQLKPYVFEDLFSGSCKRATAITDDQRRQTIEAFEMQKK